MIKATPQEFKLIAQNQLGDETLATPSICGNRLYLRAAKTGAAPQDFLWCIGR